MELARYHMAGSDERLDLLADGCIDEYFDLLKKSWEERICAAEQIMGLAREHGCVRIRKPHSSQWHMLHPSTRKPWLMQLTTWDKLGPVSHITVTGADSFDYLMTGEIIVESED